MAEDMPTVSGAHAYLASLGWSPEEERRGPSTNFELWHRNNGEVLLPLSATGPDIERRWADLVSDLAQHHHLSANLVNDQLVTAEDDVFEMVVRGDSYSIAVDDARAIIVETREMFVASACSTLARRPHHGRSRPKDARALGQVVRLAQTRRGSYVFPFISPTTPSILDAPAAEMEGRLVEVDERLFPRRALMTLSDALLALHGLVIDKQEAPTKQELNQAVLRSGVSGDLCHAVARIAEATTHENVEMAVRWSLATPAPRPQRQALSFPSAAVPLLRETAERLQEAQNSSERVVFGYVSSLERDHDEPVGTVRVKAVIDKRERPISLVLGRADYDIAAHAHAEDRRVVMQGRLNRPQGRTWTMEKVGLFQTEDLLTTDL